ncbi:TetR/AcrR family transcriptional regulator [Saccharopolyspora sp. TS4A08]|uniref:TetR/AcrR family transcriptional regulator n=1 Tax=Saccharopolyspora ipomoeae TaxID=3042027 RepID=A0ABT6PHD3_9PSEU|nr:TetR/AcrR family transcriptional regulator [Saccharopolyspora sp. TS4A08]MDI2027406.1 TetR/AcrR family transcriptional regulator [Saccharopolyspora sp. TS4A08]
MSDSSKGDTRSKILIAAATMLGEDPTARLSVRAVAARAGVSTGSLRHFFPTQQELIDTVVAGLQTLDVPDDPMADTSRGPAERLEACLQLLLAATGAGDEARRTLTSLHDAYVASPPAEDSTHAFLAIERLAVDRVERWLAVLRAEDALAPGDLEQQARFLLTVVNGLSFERAFPGAHSRIGFEKHTLALAVTAVLNDGAAPR